MIGAIKPLVYVGRIIVSTTDDTEMKVIKHYGGKTWRRMVNFLRGVDEEDEHLGRKFGEEYVCLRESNVPIHAHRFSVDKEDDSNVEWMLKGKSGESA